PAGSIRQRDLGVGHGDREPGAHDHDDDHDSSSLTPVILGGRSGVSRPSEQPGVAVAEFEEAFDELYRLAYQVAFRLTGSRDESKDAAQEALARAYVRWGRVGPYAEAWVSKVSANLVLDGWRRSRRPRGVPALSPAPTDALAADRIDLRRALSGPPRRQREV